MTNAMTTAMIIIIISESSVSETKCAGSEGGTGGLADADFGFVGG